MISFIIIGLNEGWKLSNCFESVINTIEYNGLKNYEIIYVDSKSTDKSVPTAKKYKISKILVLTDDRNAAIARNVGVKESKGDVLFFIDGDMELLPDKLPLVYSESGGIYFPFISANYENYFYDKDWNFLNKDNGMYSKDRDFYTFTTGGLFLIERHLWNEVCGMDTRFKKSQDIDFALRLAKKGYQLLRKKELLAIHHMIPYLHKDRKWKSFFENLYSRSFLYRDNILNKYTWKRILRNDTSIFIMLISLFGFIYQKVLFISIPSYFLYVLIKTVRKKENYVSNFIYFILRDILVLLGFFFFYPSRAKENYKVLEIPRSNLNS